MISWFPEIIGKLLSIITDEVYSKEKLMEVIEVSRIIALKLNSYRNAITLNPCSIFVTGIRCVQEEFDFYLYVDLEIIPRRDPI